MSPVPARNPDDAKPFETPEGLTGPLFPDVRVIEHRPQGQGGIVAITKLEGSEAILVDAESQPVTEGYIEIIDASSGNRVVSIIEVLSLANKLSGDDRQAYQRKQRDIVQS